MFHNATHMGSRLKLWNGCGTNRARIGDSYALLIRSPQHLAWFAAGGTRSSLRVPDKRRFCVEILKMRVATESNQKWERVNRDSRSPSTPFHPIPVVRSEERRVG